MKIARDKKVIWQIDQFHLLQVLDVEAAIQQRKSEVENFPHFWSVCQSKVFVYFRFCVSQQKLFFRWRS